MNFQQEIVDTLRRAASNLPEPDPVLERTIKTLTERAVLFTWCVDDVQSVRPDLNDGQAMQVLEYCHDQHDANIGMNWMFIEYTADDLFPKDGDDE